MPLKRRVAQLAFDRYFRPRLRDLMKPQHPVVLEYAISPQPRYGFGKPPHPALYEIFDDFRSGYEERLHRFIGLADFLREIAKTPGEGPLAAEPTFLNNYFLGLDAIALTAFLRDLRPATLLEIGSGNSTRFARRAVRDFRLPTRIVSCDPAPRAEILGVADEILEQPAETLPLDLFDGLSAGDVLFIDSSHQIFQNSDVTTLFLEVLPRLRRGVIVHIHDILLPYDYPPPWAERYYSEQYLLAMWLLADPQHFEILLPNAFVSSDAALSRILDPLWEFPELQRARAHALEQMYGFLGYSLWLRVA